MFGRVTDNKLQLRGQIFQIVHDKSRHAVVGLELPLQQASEGEQGAGLRHLVGVALGRQLDDARQLFLSEVILTILRVGDAEVRRRRQPLRVVFGGRLRDPLEIAPGVAIEVDDVACGAVVAGSLSSGAAANSRSGT